MVIAVILGYVIMVTELMSGTFKNVYLNTDNVSINYNRIHYCKWVKHY